MAMATSPFVFEDLRDVESIWFFRFLPLDKRLPPGPGFSFPFRTNLWSISVLTVASYWQVRISHAMALIVSAWVTPFLQNEVRCAELSLGTGQSLLQSWDRDRVNEPSTTGADG